jgi:hypothetical protein
MPSCRFQAGLVPRLTLEKWLDSRRPGEGVSQGTGWRSGLTEHAGRSGLTELAF